MCLYPRLITNPKYKANKKNGGNVPHMVDNRVGFVPIGCQNCIECLKKKGNEWRVRLQEEIKENKNGKFVTLTFSPESYKELYEISKGEGYTKDNEIATTATRRFLERWRKKNKKSVRHWLITEIGGNRYECIHLHGIIFGEIKEIKLHWKYGYVFIGNYVNEKTINYIIKYCTKKDEKHKTYKPIILTSAGIGKKYMNSHNAKLNKFNGEKTEEQYINRQNKKTGLPIYYRNKLYTEEEREKLWIQKINKNIRWVCGEKIDISKNEKNYEKLLKYYQRKNIEWGYGNSEKNWEEEQYERERRNLKQKQKINRAKALANAGG